MAEGLGSPVRRFTTVFEALEAVPPTRMWPKGLWWVFARVHHTGLGFEVFVTTLNVDRCFCLREDGSLL